ncbi:MAG TPA: GTA-gp10 family protein [Devosia sp.]|nr:GTA-gp10 family protein [Devosia sp.]
MVNPLKGEVNLVVGDKTYCLRLSINELVEVEDLLDMGVLQIAAMFNDVASLRAGNVRAVLWGALREHHPEVDLLGAGAIMAEAKLQPVIEKIAETLQAAFPAAEDKESPSPKRGRAGTGKAS